MTPIPLFRVHTPPGVGAVVQGVFDSGVVAEGAHVVAFERAFGEKFGEGAGDMGLGTMSPQQPQGPTPPGAVLAPTAGVTYDVEANELRRKKLAETMAKLNSGKLFL